jgi:pilus assembly protein FimV
MEEATDTEGDESEAAIAQTAGEIEFDLSDTGAVEEAPAEEDEFSLDIDASELDIDIQEEAEETIASEDDEIHDVGDMDIDFGLDEETPAEEAADEEIAIDLTDEAESLDLDLGEEPAAEEPVEEELVAEEIVAEELVEEEPVEELAAIEEEVSVPVTDEVTEEEDFDLSSLDDVDEVSTKLDLARAYLDMGDHEGTRGILEEVIAEGNEEQKQEASDLMAKLY